MMEDVLSPLVSVVVATYNSSKYVLETLESAKQQTYRHIELIVTDDGSTDDTVSKCREWMERNNARFVRTQIVESSENTGIPGNVNRGLAAAHGQWVKSIAGDDILLPDCVENYVSYISEHPEINVLFAMVVWFRNEYKKGYITEEYASWEDCQRAFFRGSVSEQLKLSTRKCYPSAPTLFVRNGFIQLLGGYNEKYPLMEDWPMWVRILERGEKLYFVDKQTVAYRLHSEGVSSAPASKIFSMKFERVKMSFIRDHLFKYHSGVRKLILRMSFAWKALINSLHLNHRTLLCRLIYSPLNRLFECLLNTEV